MKILFTAKLYRIFITFFVAINLVACGSNNSLTPDTSKDSNPVVTTLPAKANMVADASGNLYFADLATYTIQKLDPQGNISVVAGKPGVQGVRDGTGMAAEFYAPNDIAIDTSGNLYVSESYRVDNIRVGIIPSQLIYRAAIRKITPSGVVTTIAGSPTAGSPTDMGYVDGEGTNARFNVPQEIVVDSKGNIFVADYGNNLIRKISPLGIVSTYTGQPNSLTVADGKIQDAGFGMVHRLKIDNFGNLYTLHISGVGTALRKIGIDGNVSTIGRYLQVTNFLVQPQSGEIFGIAQDTNTVQRNLLYKIDGNGNEATTGVSLLNTPTSIAYFAPDSAIILSNGTLSKVKLP